MKGFIRIGTVILLAVLTVEAVCEEGEIQAEQQGVLREQAREQAKMAREVADLAREQAAAAKAAAKEQAKEMRSAGAMIDAGGGGGYGTGMMMEDDHGKMIMTPSPRPGMGSSGFMLPSFEMRQKAALIVPAGPLDPEVMGQITEDMHTMSQILYEKIHPEKAQGNSYLRWSQNFIGGIFGGDEGAGVSGLYLQGYGMVFVQGVDFPLVPLTGEVPAPPEPTAPTDEVWQRTQKKLKGEYEEPEEEETRKYDADQVEELKETVVQSLIHASNIRHLGGGEWVIVVVKSIPRQSGFQHVIHGYGTGSVMMKVDGQKAAPDQPSFMVIRGQKKDIDDFAADRIDQKQFMEKVTVITY